MNKLVRREIKKLILKVINDKIDNYEKEGESSPFYKAIFTAEQLSIHSILQSFFTSFGISVYEPLAVLLAKANGSHAEKHTITTHF